MNFSELPASKQWAHLVFKGQPLAEAWFKPEGEPWALRLRIPQSSFANPILRERLTLETLLKAVGIACEEVASWRVGGIAHLGLDGSNPELRKPLVLPPQVVDHLEFHIHLEPSPQAIASSESRDGQNAAAKWQDLQARWKGLLALEASVETLRMSMEGLRTEMEAAMKRLLTGEEKHHALSSDVAQWNKAKSRVHYVLPKASEFIHRAVWAKGTPERKRLDEIFNSSTAANIALAEIDHVTEDLEIVRKDRQLLSAQGVTVYQECKAICADVQGALRRLQSNAAARALKKKNAGPKGKTL